MRNQPSARGQGAFIPHGVVIVMFGLALVCGSSIGVCRALSPESMSLVLWILLVFVVVMSGLGGLLCAILFSVWIVWPERFRHGKYPSKELQ